jgi:hypothetical protein
MSYNNVLTNNSNILTNDNVWRYLLNIDTPIKNGPDLPAISIFSNERGKTPVPTTTPIPTYSTNISETQNIIAPDLLMSGLEDLKTKFQYLLDEYKKYYKFLYVDNNKTSDNFLLYNKSKQNIETYFQSLETYLDSIQMNINNINSKVYVLNENIQSDKITTGIANESLMNVTNNYIGTYEMKDDYVKKYNETYLSTFTLSIVTVLLGGTLVKIYGRIL